MNAPVSVDWVQVYMSIAEVALPLSLSAKTRSYQLKFVLSPLHSICAAVVSQIMKPAQN